MKARIRRGLYVVTDATLTPESDLPGAVEAAIAGGAVVVQYRDKGAEPGRALREAPRLLAVCRRHGVPLIINDDIELARALGADGVHLGREDEALAQARDLLGPDALIGISCYDHLDRAVEAEKQGADYVAFGSFFLSMTKPGAVRAPLELLTAAKGRLRVPVVAIGGITPDNGGQLVAVGADLLAVVSGVFGARDVRSGALAYARLFR